MGHMLLRLLFVFAFGIGVGALGISRALEALSIPEPAMSARHATRTFDARALHAGPNRSRLPRAPASQWPDRSR
jgi:hypothetical protein